MALTGGAGGFWVGYVTTRTFLTFLFDLFGKADLGDVKPAADPANLQFDAEQKPVASANRLGAGRRHQAAHRPARPVDGPDNDCGVGRAQARASNFGSALHALQKASDAAPNDTNIRSLLSKVEQAKG